MSVATVMISCRVREVARSLTIPQLVAHGFVPRVFLSACEPAGPEGNRAIAHEAFTWAATQNASVLFVEDDVDVAPEFARCVRVAESTNAVTYLYLNDSPGRLAQHHGRDMARFITAREPIDRAAYFLRRRSALFGTQCVFIPERLVPTMVEILERPHTTPGGEPFDGRLHLWARRTRDEPVMVLLPHPVQHRADRTGRAGTSRVMRSLSFGLPVTNDGREYVESVSVEDADVVLARELPRENVVFDVPLRLRSEFAYHTRVIRGRRVSRSG